MSLDVRAKLALAAGLVVSAMLGGLVVAALAWLAAEGLLLVDGLARAQRPLALATLGLAPFVLLSVALLPDGLTIGIAFAFRALAALALGLWLLRTTPARDALRLLHRWPRVGVLVAGAMRFAPMAAEDRTRVQEAMALRGVEPAKGIRGALRAAPLLVPLFVLTVRRGHAIDEALQASAFGSGPRTPPAPVPLPRAHAAVALVGLALATLALFRTVVR